MDVGTSIRRLAATGIIAAAGFAVVPGQVRAADGPIVDITLPVTLCGVQVGVLGTASGDCPDTPPPAPAIDINLEPVTSGEILAPVTGILENPTAVLDPATLPAVLDPNTIGAVVNGGDPVVNLDVPVNVCGNAVAVLTDASGQCPDAPRLGPDQSGALSGNVQVTVCGNGVGVLSPATGDCEGTGDEGGNAVGLPLGLDEAIPAGEVLDTVGTAVGPGRTVDVGQILEDAGLNELVDLNVEATICGNGAAVADDAAGACPLAADDTTPDTTPDTGTPPTTTPATTPDATTPAGTDPDGSTPATTDPNTGTTIPASGGEGSGGDGGSGNGSGGGGTLPITGGTVLPILGLGSVLAATGIFARRASRARRTLAA